MVTLPAEMSKVGRNDPCPCGSGKKFKKCCIDKPQPARTTAASDEAKPNSHDTNEEDESWDEEELPPVPYHLSHAAQIERLRAVVGQFDDPEDEDRATAAYCDYLQAHVHQPCLVTGIEDFRWEEFYVLGPGDEGEYERLKRKRPSYGDTYELIDISTEEESNWMLHPGDDIGARVRRSSDGKEFCLGLSELKAVDRESPNRELLHDYTVWFINYRGMPAQDLD